VATLADARRLSLLDHGLAPVATVRTDGSVLLTVVNAGVVLHPLTGRDVVAFIAYGNACKVAHLRTRPSATVLWRAGWSWVAVEGTVELAGPDDKLAGLDSEGQRTLLRTIAQASSIEQPDWQEFDRFVLAERRTAVLVTPARVYQNP
jgi:hypothetical protein